MEPVITVVALIVSIILHEMAHGYAANALGDPTARLQGRLSPNPLVHIDPIGSLLLPALLIFGGSSIVFGWAKPVPYNPYNLNNQKWGEALVAIAGPAMNVFLAVVFALVIRANEVLELSSSFTSIAWYIVYINILLALFNMLPIPPLDGSKILPAVLPYGLQMQYRQFTRWIEGYGIFVMFALVFIFVHLIATPFFTLVSHIVAFLVGSY